MTEEQERLIVQILWHAVRVVDAAEHTDDGMVEMKWDEFVPLADAVHNYRQWVTKG